MVSKELNDRLERSVQENSAMVELQTALNGERLRTCSSHVFTNPEFSICTGTPGLSTVSVSTVPGLVWIPQFSMVFEKFKRMLIHFASFHS